MATTPLIEALLRDLLTRAERGEIVSLGCVWEAAGEEHGIASEYFVSEDGCPPLLLGELRVLTDTVSEDIRTERWEAAEMVDDVPDSQPAPPVLEPAPKGAPN